MGEELIVGPSVDLDAICPVCSAASPVHREAPAWGNWHRCPACTLEFAQPMALPATPETLFHNAYRGSQQQSAMEEFHERVLVRSLLGKDPKF